MLRLGEEHHTPRHLPPLPQRRFAQRFVQLPPQPVPMWLRGGVQRFFPQHLCYGSLTAGLRGTGEGLNLLYGNRPEQAFSKLPFLFSTRNPLPLAVPTDQAP